LHQTGEQRVLRLVHYRDDAGVSHVEPRDVLRGAEIFLGPRFGSFVRGQDRNIGQAQTFDVFMLEAGAEDDAIEFFEAGELLIGNGAGIGGRGDGSHVLASQGSGDVFSGLRGILQTPDHHIRPIGAALAALGQRLHRVDGRFVGRQHRLNRSPYATHQFALIDAMERCYANANPPQFIAGAPDGVGAFHT
jgi:hypothetical protein